MSDLKYPYGMQKPSPTTQVVQDAHPFTKILSPQIMETVPEDMVPFSYPYRIRYSETPGTRWPMADIYQAFVGDPYICSAPYFVGGHLELGSRGAAMYINGMKADTPNRGNIPNTNSAMYADIMLATEDNQYSGSSL